MCTSGSSKAANASREAEEARQSRIRDGVARINEQFSKFDDSFYDQRAQAYLDFANPQLEEQWQKAQDELAFALARAGLTNSSVAAKRQGDARLDYERQRGVVNDTASDQGRAARQDVENARSDLISQVSSTADASSAASGAAARATMLSQRPAFNTLGPLFQNITAGLATGAETLRNQRDDTNRTGATIFTSGGGSGSSRVVR